MTLAEYNEQQARALTEDGWRSHIRSHAGFAGFPPELMYHTYDSRRSDPGFPDDVFLHKSGTRLLFIEAKRQDGKLSAEQVCWLDGLAGFRDAGATNLEVYGAVRPLDRDGLIGTLYGDTASTERLHQWCLRTDCQRCTHERAIAKPPRERRGKGRKR